MRVIAGMYKSRKICVPKGLDVRPTTNQMREAVFNLCQSTIEGARFLDLFAGSGAMGLEALSRGALLATFVENDKKSMKCIQENIEHLSVKEKTTVLFGDVLQKVRSLRGQFDIVYVDPPYRQRESYEELLKFFEQGTLLSENGIVMMESSFEILTEGLSRLQIRDIRKYGKTKLYVFSVS